MPGRRTLLALAVLSAVAAGAGAAEAPALTCSAERPSVDYGGTTRLNAWVGPGAATTYRWEVTAGTLHRMDDTYDATAQTNSDREHGKEHGDNWLQPRLTGKPADDR